MSSEVIRSATLADAKRILAIYAPSISDSATSFETKVPTLKEFEVRIREQQAKFPWLIYEVESEVAGFAYASAHGSRCAHEWSVETSIYVDERFQGKGIGKKLYGALFELLKVQGVVNIFVGITQPNDPSVKLHESMGFTPIGQFNDVGFKLGRWWDVGWWQLQLQRPASPERLKAPSENP